MNLNITRLGNKKIIDVIFFKFSILIVFSLPGIKLKYFANEEQDKVSKRDIWKKNLIIKGYDQTYLYLNP